jgi:dTDP-4-dehydrorhamnose 3,5-epimerase
MTISDAFVLSAAQHVDDRGMFTELFQSVRMLDETGHVMSPVQMNQSVSRRGVVRGIHFAELPHGQSKYVTVTSGRIVDYVVDLRVGSPGFGTWDSVVLEGGDGRAVFIAEGLGHAFVALTDDATVTYLVSDVFRPDREHGLDPLDPEIGLEFPAEAGALVLSEKDRDAPGLSRARADGILPTWDEARARYAELRETVLR